MLVSRNVAFLAFLYFVQGLPAGLQTRFLPIYFRSHGMSLSNVGFFRLLFLPWMLKAFWAPLVDNFGTKKRWLIWSMLGIAGTCFIGSFSGPDRIGELLAILFLFNLLTSTQDIAVDALAIQILTSSELSHGNIAQVVGYKFGSLCGGGLLTWLSDYFTWMVLFQFLALVYLAAVIMAAIFVPKQPRCVTTVIVPDPQTEVVTSEGGSVSGSLKTNAEENDHAVSTSNIGLQCTREDKKDLGGLSWMRNHLSVIMRSEGTMWTIVYVIVYKLGEQGSLSMIPLYLLDEKMSPAVVGFWTGVVGMIISMVGSFLGGWALPAYKVQPVTVLKPVAWIRAALIGIISMAVATATVSEKEDVHRLSNFVVIVGMMVLLLFSGMTTTMTFTLMMQCSQRAPQSIQASHYSTLATMEVVGKLTISVLVGMITDTMGYPFVFFVCTLLAVAVTSLFKYAPPVLWKEESGNKNS